MENLSLATQTILYFDWDLVQHVAVPASSSGDVETSMEVTTNER